MRLWAYEYLLKMRKCELGHWDPCSSKILEDEQGFVGVFGKFLCLNILTMNQHDVGCFTCIESELFPHLSIGQWCGEQGDGVT